MKRTLRNGRVHLLASKGEPGQRSVYLFNLVDRGLMMLLLQPIKKKDIPKDLEMAVEA